MKKKLIVIGSAVAAVLIVMGCLWQFVLKDKFSSGAGGGDAVYVTSVANITGVGSLGLQNRYSGVVEPQKEVKVKKDETKKVSKLSVAEGQIVKKGDVLFEYDLDDMNLSLEQAQLELEGIENKITTLNKQIEELKTAKNKASDDEQLSYTIQIQSAELDVKTEEYNKSEKKAEIKKLNNSIKNADVKSELDGVIKKIYTDSTTSTDGTYITILSTGNYRVKGTVSELNINSLQQDQPIIVRSRTDETKTWSGKISIIDREKAVSDDNSTGGGAIAYYGGSTNNGEQATKYNFYVELDDTQELILGQHVYIEPNYGQNETKEGLWIPSYYIVKSDDGNTSYIWAAKKDGRLEKRKVTLGEYNESSDLYQITDGLAEDEYLAFPDASLQEGASTTTEMPVIDSSSGDGNVIGGETGNGGIIVDDGISGDNTGDGAQADGGEVSTDDSVIGGSEETAKTEVMG